MKAPRTSHQKEVASPRSSVSKSTLFFGAVVILVIGFVAGSRQSEFENFIAPLFGIKTSSKVLDTSSLQNTYQKLVANYDGKLDTQKLINGANHGLVEAAGDKFTVYLDQDEAKQFNNDLSGDVGAGIGAEVGVRNNQPAITRILDDNPAKKAGLKSGDIITGVNGESAKDWTADRAASAIRGKEGTSVKLTIERDGKSMDYSLTRAVINNPSVSSSVENGIGILTISRFDEQTGALARKAAENLKRQNVSGIVLDLRSDGGGYLDAAVDVASLWLDNKLVVTQKVGGKVADKKFSESDPVFKNMKTAILVNEGTASASEILASALRDNGVGTLVGTKTYGKGTVQQLIDLGYNDALLKVTVAHWFTPDNVSINGKGLMPSKKVELTKEDLNAGRDPQLAAAKELVK